MDCLTDSAMIGIVDSETLSRCLREANILSFDIMRQVYVLVHSPGIRRVREHEPWCRERVQRLDGVSATVGFRVRKARA